MTCSSLLSTAFVALGGQEIVLIVIVVLILGVVGLAVTGLILFLSYRASRPPGPSGNLPPAAAAAIAEIDSLRASGHITDAEYQRRRGQILGKMS